MNIFCKYGTFVHELATMAQEVERRLGKAEVTGSNPVISSIKRYWLKRPIPFYCCLENNTVTQSKLINIILVQSILHILQLRCGHTDYRFPLSLSCDYIILQCLSV